MLDTIMMRRNVAQELRGDWRGSQGSRALLLCMLSVCLQTEGRGFPSSDRSVALPLARLHQRLHLRGGGDVRGKDEFAVGGSDENLGFDIEDFAGLDSAVVSEGRSVSSEQSRVSGEEEQHEGNPDTFITPSLLHDLEAPARRKAVRNPKGHYEYNRTSDRWEQRGWEPIASPGDDKFHGMYWQRQHPSVRTARRANETLEEFVRRCPCWPPYCQKCPLRDKPMLSSSGLLLHKRITNSSLDIPTALRCGNVPPFSPDLGYGLSGYCPPASEQQHLDALLLAAVQDCDVLGVQKLLRAGANVSTGGAYSMTPLHEAASAGSADMCTLLLQNGAVWNALDQYLRSPLHWAAIYGKISALVAIFNHDAGGGRRNFAELHVEVHRKDYMKDSPMELAGYFGRRDVAKYFETLLQQGQAAAQVDAASAMVSEADANHHPQPSRIDKVVEDLLVDPETAVAEGPEIDRLGPGEVREFNRYTVGPPDKPIVNEVPWGPGTQYPTPWRCWFCDDGFGTYQQAYDHEVDCARKHGWEINEAEAQAKARELEREFSQCCPGKSHTAECMMSRVPYAWVRVQEDMEFEARQEGAGAAGEDWVHDIENVGEAQMTVEAVHAQLKAAQAAAVERKHKAFVGGGWSKMARNTRKRQDLRSHHGLPENQTGMGDSATLEGHSALGESEQFCRKRVEWLEKQLAASHGVIAFNFSAVDNGTRPLGVPTASALEQLPEYLRDPATYEKWKRGEEVLPPEMVRPVGLGAGLSSSLDAQARKRLGGAADGEVSQSSSMLRKKAIAGMNKEAVEERLREIRVTFDPAVGVASLRSMLTDAEIELGLILAPKGWTRKRSIHFDQPPAALSLPASAKRRSLSSRSRSLSAGEPKGSADTKALGSAEDGGLSEGPPETPPLSDGLGHSYMSVSANAQDCSLSP